MFRLARKGTVKVDDMKFTPALLSPIASLRGGVIAVYRNIIRTPLS
jgi:hypothetical protein